MMTDWKGCAAFLVIGLVACFLIYAAINTIAGWL